MKRCLAWAAGGLLAASSFAVTNDAATAEAEGRELASRLRQLQPTETASLNGVLKIFPGRSKRIEVPVEFQTVVTATNWQVTYLARGTDAEHTASVTIVHERNQSSRYCLSRPDPPGSATNTLVELEREQVMSPFAGSDFWLADLGLEFFDWPAQKVLKKELRSGQACSVLESRDSDPAAGGYARVVSWIDIDTGGIVHAEAYDADGRRLKRFEPKALKKVNGQWQLQEMVIRNLKTGSRTTIEFKLDQP
jgi:hypothetical protein